MKTTFISILLSILIFFSYSCKSNNGNDDDLKTVINEIVTILKKNEVSKLKSYFYLENSVFFINNQGVYETIDLTDSDEYFDMFISDCDFKPVNEVKFEAWPDYDLDIENWTKEGCFAEKIKGTNHFNEIYDIIKENELREVTADEATQAKKLGDLSEVRVILTDYCLRFYFAKKDGKWLITAIDFHDFGA